MRPPSAGRFRQTVTVQRRTTTPDAYGDALQTWEDVATRRADVVPLAGRELWQAQQAQSDVSVRVRLRWEPSLTPDPTMRLAIGEGRYLQISSVVNVDNANRTWELLCTERV